MYRPPYVVYMAIADLFCGRRKVKIISPEIEGA
jgi:hypothetical protein